MAIMKSEVSAMSMVGLLEDTLAKIGHHEDCYRNMEEKWELTAGLIV